MPTPPVALTIAGSDPSGSSGLQADLPTFAALGVHGTSVITVVTAQNTTGVKAFHELDRDLVLAQIDHLVDDLAPAATKTGLLRDAELVEAVSSRAAQGLLGSLVVDPVLVDSAGRPIVEHAAIEAYRSLAASAAVLTPNRWEAELLGGRPFGDALGDDLSSALLALGSDVVVVTGGRGEGEHVVDHVITASGVAVLESTRIGGEAIRGTGCTFSAALAATIASGVEPSAAPAAAHTFVQRQLRHRDALRLGAGRPGLPHIAG
ncbi:MAG: bifunctional hydroxymethylpyrimidine kinase/phosphomethylpyrimidine kinase [Actinomycetota bacterium]